MSRLARVAAPAMVLGRRRRAAARLLRSLSRAGRGCRVAQAARRGARPRGVVGRGFSLVGFSLVGFSLVVLVV